MFTVGCLNCDASIITKVQREAPNESRCIKCHDPMYLVYTTTKPFHVQAEYELISASLAVPVHQIEEHKQAFPNIDVMPDGCIKFNSYQQHDKYLKNAGFVKHEALHTAKTGTGVYHRSIPSIPRTHDEVYGRPEYSPEEQAKLDRMNAAANAGSAKLR